MRLLLLISWCLLFAGFPMVLKASESGEIKEVRLRLDAFTNAQPDSILRYAEKLLLLARQNGDVPNEIHAHQKASEAHYFRNRRELGFEHITQAKKLALAHDLQEPLIEIYNAMGLHFSRSARLGSGGYDLDKVDIALGYHAKAIALAEALEHAVHISTGNNLTGVIYARLGESEKALMHYRISEQYSRMANDSVGLGYTLDYAGMLYASLGLTQEAEQKLLEALDIRSQLGDKFAYAINLNNIGQFYDNSGNQQLAVSYLEQSFGISFSQQFNDLALHTAGVLSRIFEQQERFSEAFELKKKEIVLKDSLYSSNRRAILEELETRYQTEQQANRILHLELEQQVKENELRRFRAYVTVASSFALLFLVSALFNRTRLQKRQLALRVEKLEAERKVQLERERISRDLHDHVGAQIVNIISGLGLAEKYHDKKDEEKAQELLKLLKDEASATIHELRHTIWTLKHNQINPEDFQLYVERYVKQVSELTEIMWDVRMETGQEFAFTSGQALHLFRILQEAVQNTVKHSGATRGKVSIQKVGDDIEVRMEDNGTFKEESEHGGSGLEHMQKRAKELNGILEITQKKSGTCVMVRFPATSS